MRKHRILHAAAVLGGLLWLGGEPSAEPVADAVAAIERLHQALVAMAAIEPDPGFAARYELIAPVIAETHDLAVMARLTIPNASWRAWDETRRTAFTEVFSRLTIASYASRYAGVPEDLFAVDGGVENGRRIEVRGRIRPRDGAPRSLSYLMQSSDDGWRIINIFIDETSELSQMASGHFATLERAGYEALLQELEDDIAALD